MVGGRPSPRLAPGSPPTRRHCPHRRRGATGWRRLDAVPQSMEPAASLRLPVSTPVAAGPAGTPGRRGRHLPAGLGHRPRPFTAPSVFRLVSGHAPGRTHGDSPAAAAGLSPWCARDQYRRPHRLRQAPLAAGAVDALTSEPSCCWPPDEVRLRHGRGGLATALPGQRGVPGPGERRGASAGAGAAVWRHPLRSRAVLDLGKRR